MKKLWIGILLSGFSMAMIANAAEPQFSAEQTTGIQNIVHDYLINNPDVLVEATQALQKREVVEAEQRVKTEVGSMQKALFNDPNSPVLGNSKGAVTLVEFLDYQCGHCRDMGSVLKNLIAANPNLKVVIKEFPIFGADSELAAKVALAAAQQGTSIYSAVHEALFTAQRPIKKEVLLAMAQKVGANMSKLQRTMATPAIMDELKQTYKLAQQLGIMGTPAFIIVNSANPSDVKTTFFVPGGTELSTLQKMVNAAAS